MPKPYGKQLNFGDYEQSTAKKLTQREKLLAEINKVVPCQPLIDLIESFNPKKGSRRFRPFGTCCNKTTSRPANPLLCRRLRL
jgi:hypothetical protein